MDEIVNIQTEFENLINELEKLKSINEYTNLNVENSKMIIKKINSFLESISVLIASIEMDYKSKSIQIEKLINSLSNNSLSQDLKILEEFVLTGNSSMELLLKNIKQYSQGIESLFSDIINETQKNQDTNNQSDTKILEQLNVNNQKIEALNTIKNDLRKLSNEFNHDLSQVQSEIKVIEKHQTKSFLQQDNLLKILLVTNTISLIISLIVLFK